MNVLKDVKFLFPKSRFVINIESERLFEILEIGDLRTPTGMWLCPELVNPVPVIEWSDHVINWNEFKKIVREKPKFYEDLILDFDPKYGKELIFYNPAIGTSLYIDARIVISNKSLKEEVKMDEEKKELTVEEKLEAAQKELADLKVELAKKKRYEEYKTGGDELVNLMNAFVDSGMSRDEAKDFAMILLAQSVLGNMVPPFLKKR